MKRNNEGLLNKVLFDIARESIKRHLNSNTIPDFSKYVILHPKLGERRGSFVTLYIEGQLKGCIGRLEGERSLAYDIAINAVDAAFYDNRFLPLSKEDYSKLQIEISLLTEPEKIKFKNEKELFQKIFKKKYGVILKKGVNRSTYLPQVWESYDNPQSFMKELAFKGGFPDGVWNEKECEVYTYSADVIKEE